MRWRRRGGVVGSEKRCTEGAFLPLALPCLPLPALSCPLPAARGEAALKAAAPLFQSPMSPVCTHMTRSTKTAPADAVFYARYREQASLIRWLNLGTINSDPYGLSLPRAVASSSTGFPHPPPLFWCTRWGRGRCWWCKAEAWAPTCAQGRVHALATLTKRRCTGQRTQACPRKRSFQWIWLTSIDCGCPSPTLMPVLWLCDVIVLFCTERMICNRYKCSPRAWLEEELLLAREPGRLLAPPPGPLLGGP